VTVKGAELYRLAVSGFSSLEAANQVCTSVRKSGGQCFVRAIGQGNPMQYAKKRTPIRQGKQAVPVRMAKKQTPVRIASR
jgi:SPOR domain